ncbi:MAG TPA: type II CAAX endopeptidase family protein [Chloroflexota bacterium]|nr:type II CAAX endopeptidase family protein [Chloroflexota bacterium]
MTPTRSVAQRGLVAYLLVTFALAWAAQLAFALIFRSNPGVLGSFAIIALLMWPPAIGAFVARHFVERSGWADSGLRWPRWRYVVIAWFLPAGFAIASMVISLPLYHFDASLSALPHSVRGPAPQMLLLIQVVAALTLAIPINSIFAFGEELGWRGYLLPRLQQLFGYWPGLLGHGAIWGVWHAPLIVLTGYEYPRHHYLGVLLFIVFLALASTILGWLRLASGSIVPSTIVHAGNNAIGALPLLLLQGVDTAIGGVIYSALGFAVLLVIIAWLVVTGRLADLRSPNWRPGHTLPPLS